MQLQLGVPVGDGDGEYEVSGSDGGIRECEFDLCRRVNDADAGRRWRRHRRDDSLVYRFVRWHSSWRW